MKIIQTAENHLHLAAMQSSAELCLADAKALLAAGKPEQAQARALKSLAYSVGVSSPIYKNATKEGI